MCLHSSQKIKKHFWYQKTLANNSSPRLNIMKAVRMGEQLHQIPYVYKLITTPHTKLLPTHDLSDHSVCCNSIT